MFHRKIMVSHLLDEAIRFTVASILPDKTPASIIEAISVHWVGRFGGMKYLVADGESGLASEEVAQYLDRCVPPIELKTKAPGEHAQMVERHHELFRRILLRIEAQLAEEGLRVPMAAIVAEGALAKNSLITVARQTPHRGLYGREALGLAEFGPTSETQLDDASGGGRATHGTTITFANWPLRPWSRRRHRCDLNGHSTPRPESQPNSWSSNKATSSTSGANRRLRMKADGEAPLALWKSQD